MKLSKKLKQIIILFVITFSIGYAKTSDTLVSKSELLKTINSQNKNFDAKIKKLSVELNEKETMLKNQLTLLESNLDSNKVVIDGIKSLSLNNGENIKSLGVSLTQKQQYGLILIGFSLSLLLLVYIILNKKRNQDTKKLAAKQKEIFEKQIEDGQQLADWLSNQSIIVTTDTKNEIDHSFAKRVADEIVRFTTNLSRMDETIKGYKQLAASVRKLEQSLNANHYELEDLLNKPYNSGMNIEATIILDENLKAGESFITRIIKPQINFKGKLIQAAQVEVSQGE
jgi:hypothetical protein